MSAEDPVTGTLQKPVVIGWFKIYCAVLCLLYLGVAAASLIFFLTPPAELDMSGSAARFMGVLFLALGLLLFGACVVPFAVTPRPWAWGYGLGLICLGMTSACFLPACVPLLLFWLKPETKRYFGAG